MTDYRAKFDSELRDILTSWVDLQSGNRERTYPFHSAALRGAPVSLRLQFNGDLAGIEARGFRTEWVEGSFARGDVELADLEAVASHPAVLQLEYGSAPGLMLETSTVEIRARGPVWTVTPAGKFNGPRGAGVVIGVIDTGIDIFHAGFLKDGSKDTTRILRIWDMGISPHDGINSPDVALLQGNVTYGVEYTDKHINDALQVKKDAKPVKHRDCFGHGTHVAAIAAGDGRAKRGKKAYEFVGVAPAADLVIVKTLYLEKDPPEATEERRFEDAVTYIERVTKRLNTTGQPINDRPVVVNVSLGWNIGPHDGLEGRDQFLATRFMGTMKKAFVAASGNEANSRQYGLIVIPAAGQIDVPFTLYDERHVKEDESRCKLLPNARHELVIEFWYRPPPSPGVVTFSLRPPGGGTKNGPALGAANVDGRYPPKGDFTMSHAADTAPRPPGSVTRNVFRIKFTPSKNSYGEGPFTLRLIGPAGTTIHAWTDQAIPAHGLRIGHDKPKSQDEEVMQRLVPLPAGVMVPKASTVVSPASSPGAIAVANYRDTAGTNNEPAGTINSDSSQGPLVDYSGTGPFVPKPDVSAPGTEITAANATNSFMAGLATLTGRPGGAYTHWDGTSASAPHVAGVAALMFEKKPNLALADLVTQLKSKARAAAPKVEFGEGKVDAKKSRDAV